MKKITFSLIFLLFALFAEAQLYQVTFQVNMRQQTLSSQISVAGNFQLAAGFPSNWDPSATAMSDANGDSIYNVTLNIPAGTYEYKFINGTAWGTDETVPGACATAGNRTVIINANTIIPAVCFGTCNVCASSADTVDVTFSVNMRDVILNGGTVDTVSVAGNFQDEVIGQSWTDWSPGQILLSDPDGDFIYSRTLRMPEGFYEYKFVNGTAWGADETVPLACQWNQNRSVNIDTSNNAQIILPSVCYASCDPCLQIDTVEVTFSVNMRDLIRQGTTVDTVSVAGTFQSEVIGQSWPDWSPGLLLLTDLDGDSVYSATVRFRQGFYEYKFVNGTTWGLDETVPLDCQLNQNRFINIDTFNNTSIDLPTVCFSSCIVCNPSQYTDTIQVTFRLDMRDFIIAGGTVNSPSVAGNFLSEVIGQSWTDWSPLQALLTDADGDSIYTTTLRFLEGNYQYKFFNAVSQENVPAACAQNGNRFFSIDTSNNQSISMQAVCFSSCSACAAIVISAADNLASDEPIMEIYPNPMRHSATVRLKNNREAYSLSIYDSKGSLCVQEIALSGEDIIIERGALKSGNYFVRILNESGIAYSKILMIE
jgi:hypothetical protein